MSNRYTAPASYRTVAGVLERHCTGCDLWFAFTSVHFHRNRANRSGLTSRCKACLCAETIAANHARKVPRIGPRNGADDGKVVWARYAVRNSRRAGKGQA